MCAASGVANAVPVTWYLHDVSGGHDPNVYPFPGYIWGDFTYDADTSTLIGWHLYGAPISSAGGLVVFPDPLDAQGTGGSISTLEVNLYDAGPNLFGGEFTRYLSNGNPFRGSLTLDLMTPLTASATLIYIRPYSDALSSRSCECYQGETGDLHRELDSGFISTTGPGSAPEPATLLYILPSLAVFGCGVLRRLR
jgi:hypothetical protein